MAKSKKESIAVTILGIILALLSVCLIFSGIEDLVNNDVLSTESSTKINLEKFNKIETGMTYQEVVNIIGEEGTVISQTDIINNDQYKTTMYCWYGEDGISNANVTIQGGKVISKAQIGLE